MADIKLEVGEGEVRNAIAVAIAESFSPERQQQILLDIVRAHLQHKPSAYERETFLSKVVGDEIRTVAREVVIAELQKIKPRIQKYVEEALQKNVLDGLGKKIEHALTKVMISQLTINVELDEWED